MRILSHLATQVEDNADGEFRILATLDDGGVRDPVGQGNPLAVVFDVQLRGLGQYHHEVTQAAQYQLHGRRTSYGMAISTELAALGAHSHLQANGR
ncbi:hypothetical protein D3C81_1946960 [compost metagenome]